MSGLKLELDTREYQFLIKLLVIHEDKLRKDIAFCENNDMMRGALGLASDLSFTTGLKENLMGQLRK